MILDIIICGIIILSTFLGYKKGLVKLASGLFAGLIAIVLTFVLYKPLSNLIIQRTDLCTTIENAIVDNSKKAISENSLDNNIILKNIDEELLPEQSKNIALNLTYMISGIIVFVFVKVVLSIIFAFLSSIAKLPILRQFNEAGGIAYGLIRGLIISYICVLLIGVVLSVNPNDKMNEMTDGSYVTKFVYSKMSI